MKTLHLISMAFFLMFCVSCNENYHLNLDGATATDASLSLPSAVLGQTPMVGTCFPDGSTVTISSEDFDTSTPGPFSCPCEAGKFDCGMVNIPGTGPNGENPKIDVSIKDQNGNTNTNEATAPVPEVDLVHTIDLEVGQPTTLSGTCNVEGADIELTSPDMTPSPVSCTCANNAFNCGPVIFSGTGPNGAVPVVNTLMTDPVTNISVTDQDTLNVNLFVELNPNFSFTPSATAQLLPSNMGACAPSGAMVSLEASPATSMVTSPATCTCNAGAIDCSAVSVTINSSDFTLTPTITNGSSSLGGDPTQADVPAVVSIDAFASDIVDGDTVSLTGTCSVPGSSISLTIPSNVDLSSGSSPVACTCPASGVFDLSSTECGSITLSANTTGGSLAATATITDTDGDIASDSENLEVTVRDADGDGVPDATDIDDDNDGILDTEEQTCVAPVNEANSARPTIWWDINTNAFPGDIEENFISSYTSSTRGVSIGTGLIFSRTGSAYILNGIDALNLTQSIANDEYVEVGFSTNNSFPSQIFLKEFITFVRGLTNTGIAISNDNFSTHAVVYDGSFGTGSGWQSYLTSSFELQENENYTIRLYFYDTVAGRLFDGFGFNFSCSVNSYVDSDSDNIENRLDLDSDNDGISDLSESGFASVEADTNNDGFVSESESLAWLQANISGAISDGDANNDGLMDIYDANFNTLLTSGILGTTPVDTDSDKFFNYIDLDSDGDTIPDSTEARASADYVAYPATIDDTADSDDDGVLDIYDDSSDFGSTDLLFITGTNTPNSDDDDTADTVPDYLDLDSDDDGISDQMEAGTIITAPSYSDPDGSVNDPLGTSDGLPNDGTEIATRMFSCPSAPPATLSNRATFNYTNSDQNFDLSSIPANTCWVRLKVWGAGGGGDSVSGGSRGRGGGGGYAEVEIERNNLGATGNLIIVVGEGGKRNGSTSTYGGGGAGGRRNATQYGGSGGGLSGIFFEPFATVSMDSDILVIAGAGGGSGAFNSFSNVGGVGGGLVGGDAPSSSGGKGGTQTAGGLSGPPAATTSGFLFGAPGANNTFGGGGGGSGYFGGGAGGFVSGDEKNGGGGSGFLSSTSSFYASSFASGSGQNAGNNTDPFYQTGVGRGGGPTQNGGNGLIIVEWE